MTLKNILVQLEMYVPKDLAQPWDNVGILIGDPNRHINKILIALDAGPLAIDFAIKEGFDMILTHHPLIFRPISQVTDPNILRMIEAKIALISMHTNFDAALGGVNYALANAIGLDIRDTLGDTQKKELGLLCELASPLSIEELALVVKEKLDAPKVKIWSAFASVKNEVSRVAICGGSGSSVLHLAEEKADIFITGDMNYHSFLSSRIPVIDAGHFYTEYPALSKLQELLMHTGIESFILPAEMHEWPNYVSYI